MGKIYMHLILNGIKTIDDVPSSIRAQVEEFLADYKATH